MQQDHVRTNDDMLATPPVSTGFNVKPHAAQPRSTGEVWRPAEHGGSGARRWRWRWRWRCCQCPCLTVAVVLLANSQNMSPNVGLQSDAFSPPGASSPAPPD